MTSLYPALGLISEKGAIVIDLGSKRTKVGFAGERRPRAIILTPDSVCRSLLKLHELAAPLEAGSKKFSHVQTANEIYDSLVWFFHDIYNRHLLVSAKERRVVIVQPLMTPDRVTATLMTVLFRHFHVVSVTVVASELASIIALGISDGLVVDFGFRETSALAIFDHIPVIPSWHSFQVGGCSVDCAIAERLSQAAQSEDVVNSLTSTVVEDIRVRFAAVPLDTNDDQAMVGSYEELAVDGDIIAYHLPGSQSLKVDTKLMLNKTLHEALFLAADDDGSTLVDTIVKAIISCPIDMRQHMAANIVMVGGLAMQGGFRERLARELVAKADFKFAMHTVHSKDHLPLTLAWGGASIYAACISFPHVKVGPQSTYPPHTCVHITREAFVNQSSSSTSG